MSPEQTAGAVTLQIRNFRLDTWTQEVETRFINASNVLISGESRAPFQASTTIAYKRNSFTNASDLILVVYARLNGDRGYLSSLQLSTLYTSGYLNIIQNADVSYWPSLVVAGPTSDCVGSDTELTTSSNDDDDELDWDVLGAVFAIALTLIIISAIVIIATKNNRDKRRKQIQQTIQIKSLEQSIVNSNNALLNASVNNAANLSMMSSTHNQMDVAHTIVIDDIKLDATKDDFHQTTLHTKL